MRNLKRYTIEEINSYNPKVDGDGYYVLEGGDYFSLEGYYYDADGYDENGGYFDQDTGKYVLADEDDDNEKDDDAKYHGKGGDFNSMQKGKKWDSKIVQKLDQKLLIQKNKQMFEGNEANLDE